MTQNIYDQHEKAFSSVSAFVVMRDEGEGLVRKRVATIAFKFPKDGASKLWAYIHWLGVPMVRGSAGGYGYDKRTAACASAVRHIQLPVPPYEAGDQWQLEFIAALEKDEGQHWDTQLRNAGFEVLQAV